jgi:hypothetical protein
MRIFPQVRRSGPNSSGALGPFDAHISTGPAFWAPQLRRSTPKAPPGKARANEALKECRDKLQNIPGRCIDVTAETCLHWSAYLANHPEANKIFRSPITGFFAETFPERDPSGRHVGLRVDYVCMRADGSAVRLHPHKDKEAKVVEGSLEEWRLGLAPVYPADRDAVLAARSSVRPPLLQVPTAQLPLAGQPQTRPTWMLGTSGAGAAQSIVSASAAGSQLPPSNVITITSARHFHHLW